MDWYLFGSMKVKYFHRFLPPCCANEIAAEGKDFRLLMAAADLWFPELDGYEVSKAGKNESVDCDFLSRQSSQSTGVDSSWTTL